MYHGKRNGNDKVLISEKKTNSGSFRQLDLSLARAEKRHFTIHLSAAITKYQKLRKPNKCYSLLKIRNAGIHPFSKPRGDKIDQL